MKQCLNLEIVSIGNIEANEGSIYFRKSDHPNKFEFNVLSSGEKEVVDILLNLYLREDIYNDSIFIIDEPELHINTSIQRKLLIEIDKLIGDNCQIWVATHSIGFIRALQKNFKDNSQIIQFTKDANWASKEYTLTPLEKSFLKWREVFSTALDDLVGLVSPKRIIYCEGKDMPGRNGQEKGFDAKVYNNIFSKKYDDTLFISSGGNTELDQRSEVAITILSKVLKDVEILVLKDRDVSSGRDNDLNDRKVYLQNNPDNHRLLKRWEIENYLFDKEVLNKYCDSKNLSFDETGYDKYLDDIVNDDVKDDIKRIRNYCGITTSINPETFKLELSKIVSEDMEVYSKLERCIFNQD